MHVMTLSIVHYGCAIGFCVSAVGCRLLLFSGRFSGRFSPFFPFFYRLDGPVVRSRAGERSIVVSFSRSSY
jgi:hypothetical protein